MSNQILGATIRFQTLSAFVNASSGLIQRDAVLNLAVRSADSDSGWQIVVPSDQTSIAATIPDLVAQVEASSDGPGDAELDLTVSMDGGNIATLAPGVYCTTVLATISAN